MSEKPEDSLGREMKQFIQDEIRRASDLPQDKLLLLFEPLIAPIQQAVGVLVAIRRSWEELARRASPRNSRSRRDPPERRSGSRRICRSSGCSVTAFRNNTQQNSDNGCLWLGVSNTTSRNSEAPTEKRENDWLHRPHEMEISF
jgi:hypothetical protein